eukprot:732233-Rhodomonas_salina.1
MVPDACDVRYCPSRWCVLKPRMIAYEAHRAAEGRVSRYAVLTAHGGTRLQWGLPLDTGDTADGVDIVDYRVYDLIT